MMKLGIKTMLAVGLMVGTISVGLSSVSAMPMLDGAVATSADGAPKTESIYYRCGYYGCRHYGYHRYYRPRYYHYRRYYRFY